LPVQFRQILFGRERNLLVRPASTA
jgi:hypothetical protein